MRLKNDRKAAIRVRPTHRVDARLKLGLRAAEIVVNGCALTSADALKTTLDSAECIQRVCNSFWVSDTARGKHRDNANRIFHHVITKDLQLDLALQQLILHHFESHPGFCAPNILSPPGRPLIPLHAIPNGDQSRLLDNALDICSCCATEEGAIGWQRRKQLSERL